MTMSPTERLLLIAKLKADIKRLQEQVDEHVEIFSTEIDLGLMDEFEENGSIVYEGVRCSPVTTFRWSYGKETKQAIKQLQELAQSQGSATQKATTSYRFTF